MKTYKIFTFLALILVLGSCRDDWDDIPIDMNGDTPVIKTFNEQNLIGYYTLNDVKFRLIIKDDTIPYKGVINDSKLLGIEFYDLDSLRIKTYGNLGFEEKDKEDSLIINNTNNKLLNAYNSQAKNRDSLYYETDIETEEDKVTEKFIFFKDKDGVEKYNVLKFTSDSLIIVSTDKFQVNSKSNNGYNLKLSYTR